MEAFSGPMARGQADPTNGNRPYKLYYSYDEMNHLLSRSGRLWSGPHLSGGGSFANNRNTDWQYDADGRVLSGEDINYTYDAAGRAINVVSNSGDLTQTPMFDGDGVRTKIVNQQVIHDQFGGSSTETTTQYFVTSSVIDEVVTELDQSGQKTRTFVYQGGAAIAWQQKSGTLESMAWEHRDLSNASVRTVGAWESSTEQELEPLGSDAHTSNPFQFPPQHQHGEDLTYPGFADLMSGNCTIDGIDAPCSMAIRSFYHGAGDIYLTDADRIWWRLQDVKTSDLNDLWRLYPFDTNGLQQNPVGLSGDQLKKYLESKGKAQNRLENSKSSCAELLAKINITVNDLISALDNQQPFSGPDSKGISALAAGIVGPIDESLPARALNSARLLANGSVSEYFKNQPRAKAATAIFGANPNDVYFKSNEWSQKEFVIVHEALHSLTRMGDVDLARSLGLGTGLSPNAASEAISKALKDSGCVKN